MLEALLNNTVTLNNVLDHGCWCAKLDPMSESAMLGGATPVDDLDDICRRWAIARHCNDDLSGGSCCNYNANRCERAQNATAYYVDQGIYLNSNNSETMINVCQQTVLDTDGTTELNVSDCGMHSCYIDFKHADEIVDWLASADNAGFTPSVVTDYDSCLLPEFMDMKKSCNIDNINADGTVILINRSDYKYHSGYGTRDTNYYAPGPENGANEVVRNMDQLPEDHQYRGPGSLDPNN